MAKKGAADKWLCQVYNSRGGFKDDDWDDFDELCKEHDMTDEFVPGKKKQPVKREKYQDTDE
jgi:hypothetical protein